MATESNLTPEEVEDLTIQLCDTAIEHETLKDRVHEAGKSAKALQEKIEDESSA